MYIYTINTIVHTYANDYFVWLVLTSKLLTVPAVAIPKTPVI